MDSNTTTAGRSRITTTARESDAARGGKRQRKATCISITDEEEPRKRKRQSTRLRSHSNLTPVDGSRRQDTPIPRVHSDLLDLMPMTVWTNTHNKKLSKS